MGSLVLIYIMGRSVERIVNLLVKDLVNQDKAGVDMKKILSILLLIILVFVLVSCGKVGDKEGQRYQKDSNVNIANRKEPKGDDDYKELALSKDKEVSISIEGMDEREIFKLVDSENLPFATYVPEDCRVDYDIDKVLINWRDMGFIEVNFFKKNIDKNKVFNKLQDIVEEYSQREKVEKTSCEVAYNMIDFKNDEVAKSGHIWLKEHGNRLFMVYWHLDNMEAGDGFGPRLNAIFKEWIWKDTEKA